MNNIVQAILNCTYPEVNKKVWQYDYGQILRIQGQQLPKAVEIHFSLTQSSGNSITRIGTTKDGVTDVPIPDSLLENSGKSQNYDIYAYIYIEDGTSGNTEYRIRIPVRTRPKPEIHETPEETELFRETIKAVNDAADRADVSERNAKTSETEAGRYAEEAKKNVQETAQTKENALEEIGEKKQGAISAIKKQEESSIGNVTEHADTEIQRIQNQTNESKSELETSIEHAANQNAKLEESIQTAGERKLELDKSIESAGERKSELINSVNAAERTKSGLDESIQTATDKKAALDTTIGQANIVDTSLKGQIGGAEKIQKNVEQIAMNKTDIGSLKEDMTSKADKTALVKTDRKLDALWKLNQGISYEFQTDDTEAYQKTVPSGAKVANVKSIGGNTIVWNQLITNARKISFSVKEEQNEGWLKTTNTMCHSEALLIKNHTYIGLLQTDCKNITVFNAAYGEVATGIFTCNNVQRYNKDYDLYVVSSGVNVGEYYFSYMLFDLTKMFGSGNEPSTVEEFEAMFPADYYPYNAGELMSAPVNEVVEQGKNLLMLNSIIEGKYNTKIGERLISEPSADISVKDSCVVIKTKYSFIGISLCTDILPTGNYIFSYETIGDEVRDTIYIINNSNIILQKIENISGSAKKVCQIQIEDNNQKIAISMTSSSAGSTVRKQISVERGSVVTEYSPYHKNTYPIPQEILNLDGYGWSVGDVRNEVDWENKQYIQRVTKYTFQGSEQVINQQAFDTYRWVSIGLPNSKDLNNKFTGDFVSDGLPIYGGYADNGALQDVSGALRKYTDIYFSIPIGTNISEYLKGKTIYYELVEPIVTDISNIIGNTFQEPLEVEAGGTLTFKNSNGDNYRIPILSSEEYVISLAEVAK